MSKRFEYLKMTAKGLRDELDELAMNQKAFCRIFDVGTRTMEYWLAGERDIPTWVPIVLKLLATAGGAHGWVRKAAADMIVLDHKHPERGEFPYRRGEIYGDD